MGRRVNYILTDKGKRYMEEHKNTNPTPQQEDEVRMLVHAILDQQKEWILGTGSAAHYAFTEDLLVNAIKAHSEQHYKQGVGDGVVKYAKAHKETLEQLTNNQKESL